MNKNPRTFLNFIKQIQPASALLIFLLLFFPGSSQAAVHQQGNSNELEFLDYYGETCNEAEGTFIYRTAINLVKDPADGQYKGVAKFHNCPGGGRVLYYVTGSQQYGSMLLLTGEKMIGGGALFIGASTSLPFWFDFSSGRISPQPVSSTSLGDIVTRPVGFINMGSIAYTIQAETFIPLGSTSQAAPSDASTVAMPAERNSSSFLGLPLGTYTWCYYWEVGDANNDGNLDYFHAYDTHPFLLDEASPDDPLMAKTITLTAPSTGEVLPGTCTIP